jgi:cardiolipin synthase
MYPAPAVLHSKHMSVDDVAAVVGSSNMDIRSFNLDFEVSVLLLDSGFVAELRAVEDHYRAISTELTLEVWRQRPLAKRYLDNVLRLTSALQ